MKEELAKMGVSKEEISFHQRKSSGQSKKLNIYNNIMKCNNKHHTLCKNYVKL